VDSVINDIIFQSTTIRPTYFVHVLSFFLLANGKVRRKSVFLKRIQGQTEKSKIRSQRFIDSPNAKYLSFQFPY